MNKCRLEEGDAQHRTIILLYNSMEKDMVQNPDLAPKTDLY